MRAVLAWRILSSSAVISIEGYCAGDCAPVSDAYRDPLGVDCYSTHHHKLTHTSYMQKCATAAMPHTGHIAYFAKTCVSHSLFFVHNDASKLTYAEIMRRYAFLCTFSHMQLHFFRRILSLLHNFCNANVCQIVLAEKIGMNDRWATNTQCSDIKIQKHVCMFENIN